MVRQTHKRPRRDELDPIELITGDLVRAVGALSTDSLIPMCPPQRLGRSTKRLVVPHFYFGDGRDRAVSLPSALAYGHRVDVMEMCFAVAGRPILIVEGKAYAMARGRMAVLLPGVRHFETYASKSRGYRLAWIVLDPRGAGVHVAEYSTRAGFASGTHANFGGIGDAAEEVRILIEAGGRHTLDVYAMRSVLLRIVARAAQYLLKHGLTRASEGAPAAIRDAESFIRRRFAESISVADVAEAAHLSPNYLSTLFRQATGRTVLESIHELKLAAAKTRLADSDEPVKFIARELGFDSSHYFSRFFHRATGSTATAYRLRHR